MKRRSTDNHGTICRRRFPNFLNNLCILVSVMGCGSPATQTAPPSKPAIQELTVAAAADLRSVLPKIIAEFQRQHPDIEVKATFGSSGNFFAQLSNKAPFDVFLSADIAYPQKLVDADLADKETLFSYAIGSIVVCARKDLDLDVESRGIEVLKDPSIKKIAIANPKHAPYGRAAEAALKHFGLYDEVADRLVLGESVSQAAMFIETGAADVGIIAMSLAMTPALQKEIRIWKIPRSAHPPLEQGGVILSWAKERSIAKQFCVTLTSERGQEILKEDGFAIPEIR